MDYKCKSCDGKFENINKAIYHLKNVHKLKEHNDRISCVVDFKRPDFCKRSYLTYNGLRTHVKSCLKIKHKHDKNSVMYIMINRAWRDSTYYYYYFAYRYTPTNLIGKMILFVFHTNQMSKLIKIKIVMK